jgi:hypothetical protein
MFQISAIKLIRTDTTLDLSQIGRERYDSLIEACGSATSDANAAWHFSYGFGSARRRSHLSRAVVLFQSCSCRVSQTTCWRLFDADGFGPTTSVSIGDTRPRPHCCRHGGHPRWSAHCTNKQPEMLPVLFLICQQKIHSRQQIAVHIACQVPRSKCRSHPSLANAACCFTQRQKLAAKPTQPPVDSVC